MRTLRSRYLLAGLVPMPCNFFVLFVCVCIDIFHTCRNPRRVLR